MQFLLEAALLRTIGGILGLDRLCCHARRAIGTWLASRFNKPMALVAVACSAVIGVVFGFSQPSKPGV